MRKELRIAGVLVAALAFLGLVVHAYKTLKTSRAPGEPNVLVVRGMTTEARPSIKPAAKLPLMEIPTNQLARLTGSGGLDSGSYFSVWITNSSTWTVSELVFQIRAVETHGMMRWERRYRERTQLPPDTKTLVRFKVSEGGAGALTEWEITAGRGHPPE